MKGESNSPLKADINVTPLVDVVLVLLVIFMLVMPVMVTQGIQLPRSSQSQPPKDNQSKSVSIMVDGSLFFENQPVSEQGLIEALTVLHTKNSNAQVIVRADRRLLYGDVHRVLDLASSTGLKNLALLAEPSESTQQ